MQEAKTQVICLLDVLGFENILKEEGLGALRARYATLIDYVKQCEEDIGLSVVDLPDGTVAVGRPEFWGAYFSDTVLFWTHYDSIALRLFNLLIADLICHGIETAMPLRGATAVGELVLDKENGVYLGEPIVEAARLEREQQWIGVSLGPSLSGQDLYLHTVMAYKSQYKSALNPLVTGIAVDWPRRWRETRQEDVRPLIRRLDKQQEFTDYYRRTLAFVEFSERNHDWFKRQKHLDPG